MNQLLLLIGIIVTIVVLGIGFTTYISSTAEKTPYVVISDLGGGVQIRQYETQTLISTFVKDEKNAFGPLGNYIFGSNERKEKISMTSPVITTNNGSTMQMSFILPAGYTKSNVPKANSEEVFFSSVEKRKLAVIRFSGMVSDEKIKQKEQDLMRILKENSFDFYGEPLLLRYNPPWTPPFMRRNEVAFEIK